MNAMAKKMLSDGRFHRLHESVRDALLRQADPDYGSFTPDGRRNILIAHANHHAIQEAHALGRKHGEEFAARHAAGMKALHSHGTKKALNHPAVQDEVVKMLAKVKGGSK